MNFNHRPPLSVNEALGLQHVKAFFFWLFIILKNVNNYFIANLKINDFVLIVKVLALPSFKTVIWCHHVADFCPGFGMGLRSFLTLVHNIRFNFPSI